MNWHRSHNYLHHTHSYCIDFRIGYDIDCHIRCFCRIHVHSKNCRNSYPHDCICFWYQAFYPGFPENIVIEEVKKISNFLVIMIYDIKDCDI